MKDNTNKKLTTWKSSLSLLRHPLRFRGHKTKATISLRPTTTTTTTTAMTTATAQSSRAEAASNVDKGTSMRTKIHNIERWPFSTNPPRVDTFNAAAVDVVDLHQKSLYKSFNEWEEHKAWRKVFAEYLFYELNRYDEDDAQRLKNQLTMTCLNFKPDKKSGKF